MCVLHLLYMWVKSSELRSPLINKTDLIYRALALQKSCQSLAPGKICFLAIIGWFKYIATMQLQTVLGPWIRNLLPRSMNATFHTTRDSLTRFFYFSFYQTASSGPIKDAPRAILNLLEFSWTYSKLKSKFG